MLYEILSTSTDHSEDAVREGIANTRPDWTLEDLKLVNDEWLIQVSKKEADGNPFAEEDSSDDAKEAPEGTPEDDAEDKAEGEPEDSKGDKKDEKGEKGDKPKGDVASELKDLMGQLQDIIKQVSDKAGDAVSEVEDHRDKLDKAKDALGEGEGEGLPGLGDEAPAPPIPGDAAELGGGAKPPMPPKRPGVPGGGGRPRPGIPGRPGAPAGGGPGIPTFTNVEVATHPGVDKEGNRISLVAAASVLEADPEFTEYEVIGMVENTDGTYSAKLKKKSE